MQNLVAPLYAQLLVEAARRLGPIAAFYKLWPVSMPPVPWSTVVTSFYSEVKRPHVQLGHRDFHTLALLAHGGLLIQQWLQDG